MIRLVALLICALLSPWGAAAHETTRSYLTVTHDASDLNITLSIAFRDLEVAVWLDENLNGQITWAEVQARLPAIHAYAQAALQFDAGGACALRPVGQSVSQNGGIAYLDMKMQGDCPDTTVAMTISSRLFADVDPDHRLLLTARSNGAATTSMLGRQQTSIILTTVTGGSFATFRDYLWAGIAHLAGGADHIVFLLVLMLPAVAQNASPGKAAKYILLAATGFTIAHALTLSAATFHLLRPQSDVIEALVALSIIVTGLDNLRPFIPAPRAMVAAFFGLIHGFGFATVLDGLSLSSGTLAVALLGFNIGIELAQIGVILFTLPVLYMLRAGKWVTWGGSLGAIAIGAYWLVGRIMI